MVNRQVNRRDKDRRKGFNYSPPDAKKLKERADQSGGNFDSIFKPNIDSWRPKPGDNQVRILPPTWEGHDHFGYEIWNHGFIGSDQSTYLCPKMMLDKKCPICIAAKESRDAGEDDEFNKLKPKKRYLYWIIDREGDASTPAVWSVAWTMDRDIAALCINKKTGKVLELDNPDEGYDLMFKRTGQKLNTRYVGLQVDRDVSPVDESQKAQNKILEFTEDNPLDQILKFYSAEHLQGVIDGDKDSSEDDEEDRPKRRGRDDDDDDKPRKRSADGDDDDDKPRKRRAAADDDEEEDRPRRRRVADDDDDDKPKRRRGADDDDEEDRPKRRSRDDDDEEDKPRRRSRDADDDEDEKPRRRSREDADDDKPKRRTRDDDDDDKPKRRSSRDDEDEDDRPQKRRRGNDDDDGADEDKPRRRVREEDPADDDDDRGDDDDDAPKRRTSRR